MYIILNCLFVSIIKHVGFRCKINNSCNTCITLTFICITRRAFKNCVESLYQVNYLNLWKFKIFENNFIISGDLVDDTCEICRFFSLFKTCPGLVIKCFEWILETYFYCFQSISTLSGTCNDIELTIWKAPVNIAIQDSWPNLRKNIKTIK